MIWQPKIQTVQQEGTPRTSISKVLFFIQHQKGNAIRVHNLAMPITNMKHLPFEHLDVTAMTHFFSKLALE